MASKVFICDVFRQGIMNGMFDLDSDTINLALVTSAQTSSYTAWAASTAYSLGDIRVPNATRNGHRYRCTVAGTSAASEPTWPTTDGDTVSDDTATWEEYGGDLADVDVWADVSGNEVATGDGYTTGGTALGNLAVTHAGNEGVWDAADVTWTAFTKTMLYAFFYASKTFGTYTNPVIGYILLDTTMIAVSVSGVDFTITFSASGILKLN